VFCRSGQGGKRTNEGLLASGSGIYLKLCIVLIMFKILLLLINLIANVLNEGNS
jgi:hypothetical protein